MVSACRNTLLCLLTVLPLWATDTQPTSVTADQIMIRVAANQDQSVEARKRFVYKQHVRVLTHKPGGKLMREETADYDVAPAPDGTTKNLTLLTGRYLQKGKYHDFTGQPRPDSGSIDAELIRSFRDDLGGDNSEPKPEGGGMHISLDEKNHDRDGVASRLFPLRSEQQKKYNFRLLGEQMFQGRKSYHLAFEPKEKNDIDWAGEAYIDEQEFQPILVFTKLSRKIPFAVRTFLGTDLPGVGFSVQYKRLEDGVWFPSSFGTEFRLKVLFFLNRDISVALDNRDFQRTHVDSKIAYDPAQ